MLYQRLRAFRRGLLDGILTPATARELLGLGSISTQDSDNVAITGGDITADSVTTADATITGGTIAADSVTTADATITGGSISGITDIATADGGTGASTAQAAAENLSVGYGAADLAGLKGLTSRPPVVTVKTGQAAGTWQWVAGDSTTADDALVVEPTSGTAGRYKRVYAGPASPLWFGLSTSATAAANRTAMAAAMSAVKELVIPDGDYPWTGAAMEPQSGARITGPGQFVITHSGSGTDTLFLIDSKDDVRIEGVKAKLASGDAYFAYARGSSRIQIIGCQIGTEADLWAGGTPIFIAKNCTGAKVLFNVINGGLGGIATGGDPRDGTGSDDGSVDDVDVIGNTINSTDTEAIDINWHTHNARVLGNSGRDVGLRGDAANQAIDIGGSVDGSGSICRDIEVANNIFYLADTSGNGVGQQNGQNGIEVKQFSENVRVHHNQIYGAGQATTFGLKYSNAIDCEYSDNVIDGFEDGGYYSTAATRAHMHRNKLTNVTRHGIVSDNGGTYTDCKTRDNEILGDSATGNGIELRDWTGGDVSGTYIRGGFLSTTSGSGRGLSVATDCSDIDANDMLIDGCDEGASVSGPDIRINGGLIRNCTTYGIDANAADIAISGLKLFNNVAGGGSEFQGRFQSGCDRLSLTNLTADDSNGTAKARGLQFLGGANCKINGLHVPRFLSTAVSGLVNLTDSDIENVGVAAVQSVTIASGAITVQAGAKLVIVDTEAAAASDDLDTITYNGKNGALVPFVAASTSRTVVVKNGTGNIWTGTDFSLDNIVDGILLSKAITNVWRKVGEGNNGA